MPRRNRQSLNDLILQRELSQLSWRSGLNAQSSATPRSSELTTGSGVGVGVELGSLEEPSVPILSSKVVRSVPVDTKIRVPKKRKPITIDTKRLLTR